MPDVSDLPTSHNTRIANDPTELQHTTALHCAAVMRLALPTREDKMMVVAILTSEAVSDDEENWDTFGARVEEVEQQVILDVSGNIDPPGAARRQRQEENRR